MRLGISRRGEEKRIDQGEYGGVHANAEREHDYRSNRKPGRLEELPKRKCEITDHGQALWLSAIIGSARVARSAGM